jgi:heme-degrading monooxygenase HmoA
MIHILWQFTAAPGRELEFEHAYGADGSWVELFRRAPGYHGTTLLRDYAQPGRYMTIDVWDGRDSYDRFKQDHADAYARIDHECESLTQSEQLVGVFESV